MYSLPDETPGENNRDIYLRREEVFHVPGLGFNGLVGFSPIAMMKNSLGTTLAVEKYGSAFFKNGAQPSGVLEHPGVLKNPEKIRQNWSDVYGGANNAHKVAVLEESMHYKPISLDGTEIVIALDCTVADLADADHGETWGSHKWLGFGIRTGLASVEGVQFTDDTGAETTLGSADASEADTLGLSAGDFVLYIKAEQEEYLTGQKQFTLWTSGYAESVYTMRIVEAND